MYALRIVKAEDWSFWRALHREGYEARVVEIWGTWDEHLQEGFARNEFDAAHDGQFIIVQDGRDAGYVSWGWREANLFLFNLMVCKDFRGEGLGGQVLSDVIAMAERRNMPVELRTLVNNPARRLYERLWFKVVGDDGQHVTMEREVRFVGVE